MSDEPYGLPAGRPLGFPRCRDCPYVINGPVHVCAACAAETITPVPEPHCEVCSQDISRTSVCSNRLCSDSNRAIDSVAAIAMFTDPLDSLIRGYKANPRMSRGRIFGRLVLGWLRENVAPDEVDLIVANPTYSEDGALGHTEMVLAHAWREDVYSDYPIPDPDRPELVKTAATPKSRNTGLANKRAVADALADVLALPYGEDSVEDCRVIVYDDVLTSGYQLDAVARFLKGHGASSVRGLVLARAPWRD